MLLLERSFQVKSRYFPSVGFYKAERERAERMMQTQIKHRLAKGNAVLTLIHVMDRLTLR
jgi:hypothetical protein